MPLSTASALFPVNATTVDTAAAIDIRLLSASNTNTAEAQSVTNSAQGTTSERTFDPANAGVTVVASATAFTGKGWALRLTQDSTPADDTNCNAVVRAGTRTVSMSGTVAVTGTLNVGASHSLLPRASLWRYNPSSDTAVLIVSGSGTTVTATAAGAWTATVSLVLAQPVELLQGEILLLQLGGLIGAGAGLLGGATSCTWTLASNVPGTALSFGQGHLAQVCSMTGSSSGTAAAAAQTARVVPTAGAAAGVASVSGALGATKQTTGTAAASATATAALGAVKGTTGAAAGSAVAAASTAIVRTTTGTVLVSSGTGGGAAPVTQDEINQIAAAAATRVWDELTATARTAGSYGALVRLDLDATVSSRASAASVAALGAPAQASAYTTDRASALDRLDVAVSTRSTPAQVEAARADLATRLAALPDPTGALAALQQAVAALGSPAQASAVSALGAPAQALVLQAGLLALSDLIGDPLQHSEYLEVTDATRQALLDEIDARATPADVQQAVAGRAPTYGGTIE